MSSWLNNFFSRRTDGSLIIKNGAACHHETSQGVYIYPDRWTVIDSFYHVEINVAKYSVFAESQIERPHRLDIFEVTMLATRDNLDYTVYGRVTSDGKLIELKFEQDNNQIRMYAKEILPADGSSDRIKVSLIKNYIDASGTS